MPKVSYTIVPIQSFGFEEETYSVKIISKGTTTLEDIKRKMGRSITGISAGAISTVVEAFKNILEEELSDGKNVDLGYIHLSLSVRGTLKKDEPINIIHGKNSIKVNAKPSENLVNYLQENMQFEKINYPNTPLQVFSFTNSNTGSENTMFPGSVCEIKGYKLKIKSKAQDDGIYLSNHSTKQETKISLVVHASHKKISFYVPTDLPLGKYTLILKSSCYGKFTMNSYSKIIECMP